MRSRTLVAAVGIPIVYLATWAPWFDALAFALLVTVACVIAVSELYQMTRQYKPYVAAGLIATAATPLLAWRALEPGIFAGLVSVLPLTMIFASLSVRRRDGFAAIASTIMPVLYIAIPAGLIVTLRITPNGFGLVLLMLAGVWATDAGAYLIGRAIGRHKLAPRISPNKTVEGFVGGVLLGTFAVWFGHFLTGQDAETRWLASGDAAMLGVVIALSTVAGDLFESMIKRAVGVKDSGDLLGEHGGMLDRLDALFLAGPVMYLGAFFLELF